MVIVYQSFSCLTFPCFPCFSCLMECPIGNIMCSGVRYWNAPIGNVMCSDVSSRIALIGINACCCCDVNSGIAQLGMLCAMRCNLGMPHMECYLQWTEILECPIGNVVDVVPMHHEQFKFSEASQRGVSDPTDGVEPEERTQLLTVMEWCALTCNQLLCDRPDDSAVSYYVMDLTTLQWVTMW